MKTIQDFMEEDRTTSPGVLECIAELAGDYHEAVRIWENPTRLEFMVVCATVVSRGGLMWPLKEIKD